MKVQVILMIGLSFVFNLSSQKSQGKEIKPKGMKLIPEGNFIKIANNTKDTLNIKAFWVSNEVTNAEYKEFVDYALMHTDEELSWVNLEQKNANKYRNLSASTVNRKEYITSVKYSEINDLLIDLTKQPFEDYFSNSKYANHPVVGVSHKAAEWFCAWKSEMEVKKHVSEGKPLYFKYRLPSENEWVYLASQIQHVKKEDSSKKYVPSNKGGVKVFGIYHILDNVSEWTSANMVNTNSKLKIVKGGSCFISKGIYESELLEENTAESYIGFRIARSNMWE